MPPQSRQGGKNYKTADILQKFGAGKWKIRPGPVCGKYATRLPEVSCDGIVGRVACEIAQPGIAPADGCISVRRAARISAVGSYDVRWESPALERCLEHRTLLVRAKQQRSPEADVH
jgi:hypothetical protein